MGQFSMEISRAAGSVLSGNQHYQVSTVQLDMLPAQERPLAKRVRIVGRPSIGASFNPPVVQEMTPASGPAGTTITFSGRHLAGWRATVSASGQRLVEEQVLADDIFKAVIPAGTPDGFYDIRVSISQMFRRAFMFEVTP